MQLARRLVAILVLCTVTQAQNISLPPVPNLEPVSIHRDSNALAHIFSSSDVAAFYGFGLAQMRDLPVSTARNFALAAGEMALIFGPGTTSPRGLPFHVALDLRARLWRVDEIAAKQDQALPADIRARLRAYVSGVNAGRLEWLANATQLANNTEPLAFDLATILRLLGRPITLDDVLCHGVQLNGINAMNVAEFLAQSDDPQAKESAIRTASNSFAIGKEASTTGVPMTIADPHLGFQDISQLRAYFAQIAGGTQDVCGISFPAMPSIAMGFNARFSWAITSNNPDGVDVWTAPSSGGGATFLFDNAQVPIIRENVTIQVVDPATGLVSAQTHSRAYAGSYDRPITHESPNTASTTPGSGTIWYAGSTFDTDVSLWEFFIRLGQCHSVEDARKVFDMNVILAYNFLCADDQGGLSYFWSGRIPRRGKPTPGTDWSMVQDGTKSRYQWNSVHGAGDLPYEYLRSDGLATIDERKWLQCNVAANLVRPGTDMKLSKFPDYMVHPKTTPLTWRQVRGRQMLETGEAISPAELRAMAIDDKDLWWPAVAPLAAEVMDEFWLWQYPEVVQIYVMLQEWDGSTKPEKHEPLIQHLCWAYYGSYLNDLKLSGQTAASYDDFGYPEQVPTLTEFRKRSWQPNRKALSYALIEASNTWRNCINPVFTQLAFPSSPWTPNPFQGLRNDIAVWGTAHYIDITPFSSPAHVAAYPVAGGTTMLALGNTDLQKPWETILENTTVLGQTGTLVNIPINSGAHTLLHVELYPGAPQAWFLEAIGPSEVASDADRYRYVQDFVDGNWLPFPTKLSDIAPNALSTENLLFDTNFSSLP